MKKRSFSLAHICAYLSLAMSIIIMVLWCCNVGGFKVVSLDSFVGVIVALLAIIVTIAIAWQIFNSIELKNKIEELYDLKQALNDLEKENQKQTNKINHLIFASMAETEINRGNQMFAFHYLMKSLKYSMLLEEPLNIDKIFDRMDITIGKIKNGTKCNSLEKIQDFDNSIRKSKCYKLIKTQYESKYDEFISKVKEENSCDS